MDGSKYTYFKNENDKNFNLRKMQQYFENKQELDKYLEKLITPYIESKKVKILDAPCGIGHLSYFLSNISPKSSFLGIDQTQYLIEKANTLCKKENIKFEIADIYDLPKKFKKEFDITINWKTISWLPYYDKCIESLFQITKKHIFLSSLFYDGDIDFEIKVREFRKESGKEDYNSFYNILQLTKIQRICI